MVLCQPPVSCAHLFIQPFDACARYFQTALEEEQEQDGTISVGSLCAAWDKVKNDMITMCVHPHPAYL